MNIFDEFWTHPPQLSDFRLVERRGPYLSPSGAPVDPERERRYIVKYRFYACGQRYGVALSTDDVSDASRRLLAYANQAGTLVQCQVHVQGGPNDLLPSWDTQHPLGNKWPSL